MKLPRGSKVRLALLKLATRAQPTRGLLTAIARRSLASLITASDHQMTAEWHAQRNKYELIKPNIVGWLEGGRESELRTSASAMRK